MNARRWISLAIVLFVPLIVVGQTNVDTAEEAIKKRLQNLNSIIDIMVADIPNFRLGANRALIYATSGRLSCKPDQARAMNLFRASIGELLNAQMIAESQQKGNPRNELLTSQTTRPRVLRDIAVCDAEFALRSFYQTRPATLQNALSIVPERPVKIGNSGTDFQTVNNENRLEQSLIGFAAAQNPDRAIDLLKEALKKDLSMETFALLKRLYLKNPEEAAKLAENVIDKLLEQSFAPVSRTPYSENLRLATAILTDFIRVKSPKEKALTFSDSQMRSLAEKAFGYYLDQDNFTAFIPAQSLIQIAEKLSPGYVAKLQAQEKSNLRRMGADRSYDPGVNTLLRSNPTAEKLIAEAKKFPLDSRRQIYTAAANRLADKDNLAAANALLDANFSDDALVNAKESLNFYYAHRLVNLGKLTEAERLISEFPERNLNSSMINLALAMYASNEVEIKERAVIILDGVRTRVPTRPVNQQEMANLMQLVSAYSKIDPPQGFQIIESVIPQLNQLVEASALVKSYEGAWGSQDDEFLVAQGMPFGNYFDNSIFWGLAEKDFDRTSKLLSGVSRPEMRISLIMGLAENVARAR